MPIDQVAFPMTGHGPVGDLGGTLADRERFVVQALPRPSVAAGLALGPSQCQLPVQIGPQAAAGLDVERLVDRLVGHTAPAAPAGSVLPSIAAISLGDQPWSIHSSMRRHSTDSATSLNALGCGRS